MTHNFQVSVIIPVHNREKFISKAIMSAVQLEEVGEIVIVDDGSTDNTCNICEDLKSTYPKISLYQHPDKKNQGVSSSRNLGIEHARCNFISFLDSDDFYLPNRFKRDKELFEKDKSIDGVYNALGIYYYTESGREKFYKLGYQYQEFLSVTSEVKPEELFFVLFNSHDTIHGEFHGNTLTVKKEVFKTVGFFPGPLKQREDIHMWRRMAAKCKLVSGSIHDPVAVRCIHDANTMTNPTIQPEAEAIWWHDLYGWMKKEKIKPAYLQCFRQQYLYYKIQKKSWFKSVISFAGFYLRYPSLIRSKQGSFDYNFYCLMGRGYLPTRVISLKNKILPSA